MGRWFGWQSAHGATSASAGGAAAAAAAGEDRRANSCEWTHGRVCGDQRARWRDPGLRPSAWGVAPCGAGLPGLASVIGPPGDTRIWLAAGVTDMRRGMYGLAALVETTLAE